MPSNIFAGYFSVQIQHPIEISTVIPLILISVSLYAAGVILNDVADRKIDLKERPNRPIPSGKITLRNAVFLASLLIVTSIVASLFISVTTLVVVVFLIVLILLYDFLLKNSSFSPVAMSGTRVVNVLLGASTNLTFIAGETDFMFYRLLLVCASEFTYISGISILSKYETLYNKLFWLRRLNIILLVSPLIIGTFGTISGFFNDSTWIYLVIFGSFMSSILIPFSKSAMTNFTLQKIISLLVTGVIIHDAVYIGGSLDSWYAGMSTFVLLLPTILLARKFYVT